MELVRNPRHEYLHRKRSIDQWIILKVKAFSQHNIQTNYNYLVKYLVGDFVNEFYIPEVERKGVIRTVIPFVMFTNVTKLDWWYLISWRRADSNIYNIYHNRKNLKVYTVSEYEMSEMKKSLEEYKKDMIMEGVLLGDSVTVKCGPFMGVSGKVLQIRDNYCKLYVTVGLRFATNLNIAKNLLMKE